MGKISGDPLSFQRVFSGEYEDYTVWEWFQMHMGAVSGAYGGGVYGSAYGEVYGGCMGAVWKWFQVRMGTIWEVYGSDFGCLWGVHVRCM